VLTNQMTTKVCAAHSPIRSYRYTVAMFPLPYRHHFCRVRYSGSGYNEIGS
jgi:hypothetical protein